jgi:hypothetical protein
MPWQHWQHVFTYYNNRILCADLLRCCSWHGVHMAVVVCTTTGHLTSWHVQLASASTYHSQQSV